MQEHIKRWRRKEREREREFESRQSRDVMLCLTDMKKAAQRGLGWDWAGWAAPSDIYLTALPPSRARGL